MNLLLAIFLFILFALSNAMMMEIRSHWDRVFAHWFPPGKDSWWNPATSWQNKYKWWPQWLFKTALVFTTDFWHFLQTLGLTSIFLLFLLYENKDLRWWQYGYELIFLFCCWGAVMWATMTILGWISDKWNNK